MARKIDVLFAIPSLEMKICAEQVNAMIGADRLLRDAGYKTEYLSVGGDYYLSKIRSRLATSFLEDTDAEYMFCLDDDVGFDYRKPLQYVKKDVDIIAGIYPKRDPDQLEWPVRLTSNEVTEDGFSKADLLPTGFMCIKRRVLEKLAETCNHFYDSNLNSREKRKYLELFQMGIHDHHWLSEDYVFSLQAKALGFDLWADTNHLMTHRGHRVWIANIRDSLKSQPIGKVDVASEPETTA